MKSFRDTAGREWRVEVNVHAIERVRDVTGVNFYEALSGDVIDRLGDDPSLLVDVLFVLIEDQARELGVSDEQFGRAMGGDSLDHATTALLEEVVGFFPTRRRTVLAAVLQKSQQIQQAAATALLGKLTDPSFDAAVARMLSESSTSSPASPASTPTGSPSES